MKKKLTENLKQNKIKLYQLEQHLSPAEAAKVRLEYISEQTGLDLEKINRFNFNPESIYKKNCENVIGGVSVPVGIAGPLELNGGVASGKFIIPLATTEGALVASVNRGISVMNSAGGVNSISNYIGITRAPLFKLQNISESNKFKAWVEENRSKLISEAESTSNHLKINQIQTFTNGKYVWLRINFNTSDAMGMNMAVVASKKMSKFITSNFKGVKLLTLSGNMCTDKKPAAINSILGRGRVVESEISIPIDQFEKKMKVKAEDFVEVVKAKTQVGSMMAGSLGYNAHVANIIAAIFIATGQDPAQVVGATLASFNAEISDDKVYCNIRIPALNIATVGGGTKIDGQNALLKLILKNLDKENKDVNETQKLAEIIGGVALAAEISLHAALCGDGFVDAHEKLGR